jgi:hypothetical protein
MHDRRAEVMPLLDHFHPPLYPTHRWESFHARWAVAIADALNDTLPARYFAETQVHLGARAEADVVELEHNGAANGTPGGVATATYAPPKPVLTFPGPTEDDVTVEVRDRDRDSRVAAVVELLGPRNKDRDEARRAFAAKVVAYLRLGAGLVVLDVVTSRSGNAHNDLVSVLKLPDECRLTSPTGLSATAYQPASEADQRPVGVWFESLTVGTALPGTPLWVCGFGFVPLDLEATYSEARQRSRLT